MMKKRISIFLCVLLCVFTFPLSAFAAENTLAAGLAADLKVLGLFEGTDAGFELGRAPTRTEALVMLVRVLGKDAEARTYPKTHPFADVPAWADGYVSYAYANSLTKGTTPTTFGGSGIAGANTYLTFVLRALGYHDSGGETVDFTYDDPFTLARAVRLLPDGVNTGRFYRADVVLVSYAALPVLKNGSAQTLADSLIAARVFTRETFESIYKPDTLTFSGTESGAAKPESPGTGSGTELTGEQIYARCLPSVFYLEVTNKSGKAIGTGSGFFISSSGKAVTNYHVIQGAAGGTAIMPDGTKHKISGVYDYNSVHDWAVLQVEGSGFTPLTVGDPSTIVGGALVYAIGSPQGLDASISNGLIAHPNRKESDGTPLIQISVPISHGSSGGALLNKYGEVIGITTSGYTEGQNLNFAIPMSLLNGYASTTLKPFS